MSHATHQQGHDNILHDIIGRDQLIVLENEPDLLVAYHGQIVLLGLVDCHAIQIIFPTAKNFLCHGGTQYAHLFLALVVFFCEEIPDGHFQITDGSIIVLHTGNGVIGSRGHIASLHRCCSGIRDRSCRDSRYKSRQIITVFTGQCHGFALFLLSESEKSAEIHATAGTTRRTAAGTSSGISAHIGDGNASSTARHFKAKTAAVTAVTGNINCPGIQVLELLRHLFFSTGTYRQHQHYGSGSHNDTDGSQDHFEFIL